MAAPARPSNRAFLRKVLAQPGVDDLGARGDYHRVRTPDGVIHKLRPEGSNQGNSQRTIAEVCNSLALSFDQLWADEADSVNVAPAEFQLPPSVYGPTATIDEPAPAKAPRSRGHTAKVLSLLIGQARPMQLDELAETTGLTRQQVTGACGYLVNLGQITRVVDGMYEALREQPADVRIELGVEARVDDGVGRGKSPVEQVIDFGTANLVLDELESQPLPTLVPDTPARKLVESLPSDDVLMADLDLQEEIATALELLFPEGFKARHLPIINRWQSATAALIREVRNG